MGGFVFYLSKLCGIYFFCQVSRTLTITNPVAPPFQKLCQDCKEANIVALPTEDCFCNICGAKKPSLRSGLLHATITCGDLSMYFVNIEGQWLEAILHQSKIVFWYSSQLQQIQLLNCIGIVGKFLLSTTSYLTGFKEDFQPIAAPHGFIPQPSQIVSTIGAPELQVTSSNVDLQLTP